jgi:cob(I)alamin adenosyltransferase
MMDKGLIHLYFGDGKGKTTASLGLAMRALGSGYMVHVIHFLKFTPTGEHNILKDIPNATYTFGKLPPKFTWKMSEDEVDLLTTENNRIFQEVFQEIPQGVKLLLILDEIVDTYEHGAIDKKMVMDFLTHKPDNMELVLTGRYPSRKLIDLADYVSEIKKIKHPYDKGILARKGIEK